MRRRLPSLALAWLPLAFGSVGYPNRSCNDAAYDAAPLLQVRSKQGTRAGDGRILSFMGEIWIPLSASSSTSQRASASSSDGPATASGQSPERGLVTQVPEVSQQAVDVKVWPGAAQAAPGVPGKNEAVQAELHAVQAEPTTTSEAVTTTLCSNCVKKQVEILSRSSVISQMHIPKTAGTSLYKQMKPQGVRFKDISPGGDEKCFYFLRKEGAKNMVGFFRRPSEHVYSMYLECKYDNWGKWTTNHTGFPRDPTENITSGYVPAFDRWLDHFGGKGIPARRGPWYDFYNCYDPWNMQTRYLTCDDPFPDGGHRRLIRQTDNVQKAIENMRGLWFVGIMEHYKASLCMLMFQLQLSMAECDCQSQATAKHVHERHGVPYHDINLLPGTVRAKIDAMTAADMELYQAALQEFRARIAYVEAAFGDKILCTG